MTKECQLLVEIKVMYGEEESPSYLSKCKGCMFYDRELCDFPEFEDSEFCYICEADCAMNITKKELILTKERTERSICRLVKLSGGDWIMELLENEGK